MKMITTRLLTILLFRWSELSIANINAYDTTIAEFEKNQDFHVPHSKKEWKDYKLDHVLAFVEDVVKNTDENEFAFASQQERSLQEELPIPNRATSASLGYDHTCALLADKTAKCWGDNEDGQLGLGDVINRGEIRQNDMGNNLPRAITKGNIIQVATGEHHSCALFMNGQVRCWGWNVYGQLGSGDDLNRGDKDSRQSVSVDLGDGKKVIEISAGFYHTCALFEHGKVKCWGLNEKGQLGYGDRISRGDNAGEMGNDLPYVDLGDGVKVKSISCGFQHTCAILKDKSLKCWGYNAYGQLGIGFPQLSVGGFPGDMGDDLPRVNVGSRRTVRSVATGGYHTCAILDNHVLKCWGNNLDGQLGLEDLEMRGGLPRHMGDNLSAVNLGGGYEKVHSVSTGTLHTCAVVGGKVHVVKCWGKNVSAQLGLGDYKNRGDERGSMGDALPVVQLITTDHEEVDNVACGDKHTCAIMNNGVMKCWGDISRGRLGYGEDDLMQNEGGAGTSGPAILAVDLGTD
mmetsp:Transcript_50458/g.60824  ORF Transcript_50458/g.60824 Transcript_50458/m.60824 type:complete len:515 (-) Transcript_50458:277-1821(-)